MIRNILPSLTAALILVVPLAFSCAQETQANSPSLEASYVAPQLLLSRRPVLVEYAPGRLIEGYVTLELRVGTDGVVKNVKVLYRTSALAVKSAVNAVAEWRFSPATLRGNPVEALVAYSLPFGYNLPIFANKEYPDRILDPDTGAEIAMR